MVREVALVQLLRSHLQRRRQHPERDELECHTGSWWKTGKTPTVKRRMSSEGRIMLPPMMWQKYLMKTMRITFEVQPGLDVIARGNRRA
jgi:hypothetical protein